MDQARLDDVTLAHETAGAGETLLLIHGALIADACFPLLRERRLTRQYQVIAYHRRGYGQSSPLSASLSIAEQSADALALLDALGIERAHVLGHSYGGAIALQLALAAPARVRTLALLEPALMIGESALAYRAALEQAETQYQQVDPEITVEGFWRARFLTGIDEDFDGRIPGAFQQALAGAETTFVFELPALRRWECDEHQIQSLSQPVLSVIGAESDDFSPRFREVHQWLLETLPYAEGFVLPDAAHGLQMTNPRPLARALAGFLARHPI